MFQELFFLSAKISVFQRAPRSHFSALLLFLIGTLIDADFYDAKWYIDGLGWLGFFKILNIRQILINL